MKIKTLFVQCTIYTYNRRNYTKIITRHIKSFDLVDKAFQQPSLNEDGSVFADEAWHNISNIEIACDLNSKESLDWKSRVKNKLSREEEENMYQQIT